jgi:membrane protein DedA with SNARE-associated domain
VAELSASSRAQRLPTTCACLICSRTVSEACRPYVCRASAAGFRWPRGSKVHIDEAKPKVGRLMFDRQGGKVVFFGRFISILRTYVAFMAGVNRMPWCRFFLYNAADGVLWSGIYAVGFYYAGNTLKRFRGPVDVALGGAAAVAVVVLARVGSASRQAPGGGGRPCLPGPARVSQRGPPHPTCLVNPWSGLARTVAR